jgi:hypothetical protein
MTEEQQGWDEPELGEADDDPTAEQGSPERSRGTETADEPSDSTAGEVGDPGREA